MQPRKTRLRLRPIAYAIVLTGPMWLSGCFWDDDDDDDPPAFSQVDRKGIPALNTVFNHPANVTGFSKLIYNQRGPEQDTANYRAQFTTVLTAVKNANPAQTLALLLPDALPVKLAAGESDFAQLNGRRLQDDAVDIALTVTLGDSLAALRSDHVDANDKSFLAEFPYLAPPHAAP